MNAKTTHACSINYSMSFSFFVVVVNIYLSLSFSHVWTEVRTHMHTQVVIQGLSAFTKPSLMISTNTQGSGLFVGCLTSQQHASVSQRRICSDNCTRCHTEIKVADQTFYLTKSQYTDTGPTNSSADPIMPEAWQGSHWSANF